MFVGKTYGELVEMEDAFKVKGGLLRWSVC